VSWTTVDAVVDALGETVDVDDPNLPAVVDAANAWAFRKRFEAGYVDDPDVAPDGAVAYGTTLRAVGLYRQRGSADSYASFEDLSTFAPVGAMGEINRLLGVGRGRVDTPADLTAVPLRGRRHPSRYRITR